MKLVQDLTVMVQREVARRIVAGPGTKDYGILSLFSRFYGMPRKLFDVFAKLFLSQTERRFYGNTNINAQCIAL